MCSCVQAAQCMLSWYDTGIVWRSEIRQSLKHITQRVCGYPDLYHSESMYSDQHLFGMMPLFHVWRHHIAWYQFQAKLSNSSEQGEGNHGGNEGNDRREDTICASICPRIVWSTKCILSVTLPMCVISNTAHVLSVTLPMLSVTLPMCYQWHGSCVLSVKMPMHY